MQIKAQNFTVYADDSGFEPYPNKIDEAILVELEDFDYQGYASMIYKSPMIALPKVKALVQKYPQVHQFKNYLYTCYLLLNRKKDMSDVIELSKRENPDYFFNGIMEAEALPDNALTAGKIFKIMCGFDIIAYANGRTEFAESEFYNFVSMQAKFLFLKSEYEALERLYSTIEEVGPPFPKKDWFLETWEREVKVARLRKDILAGLTNFVGKNISKQPKRKKR